MPEQDPLFSLSGLVCLVTGAGSGIGRATAGVLSRQGATVVVNDIDAQRAAETADESGAQLLSGAIGDVTQTAVAADVVAAVMAEFGPIDILVNNAAAPVPLARFADIDPDDWPRHMSSMHATLNCTRAALPHMTAQGWGRVVNITSIAGSVGVSEMVLYGAGKGAIHAFSIGLGKEVAASGVTVNCVAPGSVDTPRQRARDPQERAARMNRVPMGRFAEPDEIGAAVAFLASREAGYISGEIVYVDGGRP